MLPVSEGFLSYMAPVCWNHLASDDKYDSDGHGDSDVVLYMGVSLVYFIENHTKIDDLGVPLF